ncbi:hypothetical protein AeRB84_004845 [Aphanomyces euteiches]|nr:hypothetical protein AeRB84_004845 [Aphanomyces euteiches]
MVIIKLALYSVPRTRSIRVQTVVPSFHANQPSRHESQRAKRTKALARILLNLLTANSIVCVSTTIIGLASIGFFHGQTILNDLNVDGNAMQSYGQTCRMDRSGFIAETCSKMEIEISGELSWTALGQQLALQWQSQTQNPYYVTTCTKVKPTKSNQTAIVLLAGYDRHPLCQPPAGPQEIAGIAMLETTIRDEYPKGAFMLTVFADKTMSESVLHVNSDGSTDRLIANINQTLIATNGSMAIDLLGVNSVQYSRPIGDHYVVSTSSYPVVLDITNQIGPGGPTWWNIGRESKKAVTMTWDYGHNVAHGFELVGLELGFLLFGAFFISGDFYLTYQGLKGFLADKPVMTYDLAAGLERRKIVMCLWTLSHSFSLVYPDIVRLYNGSTTFLWILAMLLVLALYICAFFAVLGFVSMIPSPFTKVLAISSHGMGHIFVLVFELAALCQLPWILEDYKGPPLALSLNISGTLVSSGAYANGGHLVPAVYLLLPTTLYVVGFCAICSIVWATYHVNRKHGTILLDVAWTRGNGFLKQCGMPNWITGLPLDELKMIKIGHKQYCKPSIQVTLGYATIVARKPSQGSHKTDATHSNLVKSAVLTTENDEPVLILVSVYSLLPVLATIQRYLPKSIAPCAFGTINKNELTPESKRFLDKDRFNHDRGTCVN